MWSLKWYNSNMKNFVLSPNVKKYFVNALKSIGLRKPGQVNGAYQEMSETEISMLLDDTTTSAQTIYNGIKLAVLQQFQNDAKSNKLIQKNTALDRQVVNDIMVNDLKIAPASSNRLLRSLTAASVDENGKVTALKVGETMITVTTVDGGYKDYCIIKVTA